MHLSFTLCVCVFVCTFAAGQRQRFEEIIWSNKRYHQECGHITRIRKTEKWRKDIAKRVDTPQCIKDYILHPESIPTKKTHNFNAIVEAIIYSMILLSNGIVERVNGLKKFLALRYIVHKKQQQTFEKICDEITGTKNHELGRRTCIVAYGDASFSSSGRAGSNVLSTPTNCRRTGPIPAGIFGRWVLGGKQKIRG